MYADADWRDVEAIRDLKAKYVRFGDTQQWDEFAKLFVPEFVGVFDILPRATPDAPQTATIEGLDAFIGGMSQMLVGVRTVHQLYSHEIDITGPTTAKGIWAMHDWVQMPTSEFKGWGHYHEDYVKVGGAWKIKYSRTTRLRFWEKFQ